MVTCPSDVKEFLSKMSPNLTIYIDVYMIYSTPVFDKYPRPKNREILQNKTKKKLNCHLEILISLQEFPVYLVSFKGQ